MHQGEVSQKIRGRNKNYRRYQIFIEEGQLNWMEPVMRIEKDKEYTNLDQSTENEEEDQEKYGEKKLKWPQKRETSSGTIQHKKENDRRSMAMETKSITHPKG